MRRKGTKPRSNQSLVIGYGGYFTCRVTTDPDPTDDPYGTSGYTMALNGEPVLDQIIHTQPSPLSPVRRSDIHYMDEVVARGVRVESISDKGQSNSQLADLLKGAIVELAPYELEGKLSYPKFISHNNTVGSDDTMAFVVEPYCLEIKKTFDCGSSFCIRAVAVIDTDHPGRSAVGVADPRRYLNRLSSMASSPDSAHQAIGVYDEYGYFKNRRDWLNEQTRVIGEYQKMLSEVAQNNLEVFKESVSQSRLVASNNEELLALANYAQLMESNECELAESLEQTDANLRLELQNLKSRLYQLEHWGDRVINKLGFQCNWSHAINFRREIIVEGAHPGLDDLRNLSLSCSDWRSDYWFGGWDGDLLTGYMKGALEIPMM